MSEVDPFIIKIPNFLWNHPDPEVRNYFQYLNRWAQDIWVRTGADQDQIGNQAIRESFPWDLPEEKEFQHDFSFNDQIDWNEVTVTANYTANDFDIITASVPITITFPSQPEKESQIIFRNGGAKVVIDGNGKNVNYKSFVITKRKGTVLHFRYMLSTDDWAIV